VATAVSGKVLAPLSRQAAWLNPEAPQPRFLTHFADPVDVTNVTAVQGLSYALMSVSSPYSSAGNVGDDLYRLDMDSGDAVPLLKRSGPRESLTAPAWWPDGSGAVFERDNLDVRLPAYPGEVTPRYESRVESLTVDGSSYTPLVDAGRMPAPAPDDTSIAVVQTNSQGTQLALWSHTTQSTTLLVPPGQFVDIGYPRFSPDGRQLAFLVPEEFIGSAHQAVAACGIWLSACVALAHGLPWNLWVVNTDGTNLHEIAAVESDDGSVAWSPDDTSLLVYGGSGGYVVDAATGDYDLISYLSGYGAIAWLPD
jgi:Tol biopolymer transport system component